MIIKEIFTGTQGNRPEWKKLNGHVSRGDMIVFDSVSRMSRNAEEGFRIYRELYDRGVELVFLKERHIDTASFKEAMDGVVSVDIDAGDAATNDLVRSIMDAVNRFMMNKCEADIRKAFEQAEKTVSDQYFLFRRWTVPGDQGCVQGTGRKSRCRAGGGNGTD